MSPAEYPGVIIDPCVPRTPYDRCVTLFDYLVTISEVGPHADLDPYTHRATIGDERDGEWDELEDDILAKINDKLPDEYVCTVGEVDPGCVIVREVNAEEEGVW